MSTTLVRRLPELAAEITKEHALCERGYRTALGHALKAGELLIEAKGQLKHGDWLPWLAEHVQFGERTARAYMQLAGAPGLSNRQAPADLSIEDALRAIAQPAPEPGVDLRTALKGVDQAEAQAALAELGPMRREAHPFPESEPERETWRQVHQSLERLKRAMDEASAVGLSPWSRQEALHEAARHARKASALLTELADGLAA